MNLCVLKQWCVLVLVLWCFLIPCGSSNRDLRLRVLSQRKVHTKIMTRVKSEHSSLLGRGKTHRQSLTRRIWTPKLGNIAYRPRESSVSERLPKRGGWVFKAHVLANFCLLWTFANTISGVWKKTHEKDLDLSRAIMQSGVADIPIINNPYDISLPQGRLMLTE